MYIKPYDFACFYLGMYNSASHVQDICLDEDDVSLSSRSTACDVVENDDVGEDEEEAVEDRVIVSYNHVTFYNSIKLSYASV